MIVSYVADSLDQVFVHPVRPGEVLDDAAAINEDLCCPSYGASACVWIVPGTCED